MTISTDPNSPQREEWQYLFEEQQSGPNNPLLSMTATSDDVLFATGAYGTMLTSRDRGHRGDHYQPGGIAYSDKLSRCVISKS